MFSLLLPTRGRVKYAENFLQSVLTTESFDNEIIFYIQNDDSCLDEYMSMFNRNRHTGFIIGKRFPTVIMWDILAKKASNDYLILISDDVIIHSSNWDKIIHDKLSKVDDNIFVAGASEFSPPLMIKHNYPFWDITCHPIIHRRVYELLGYLIPLCFQHAIVDVWLSFLGNALNRYIYFPHVSFEHLLKTKGRIGDETAKYVTSKYTSDFYIWHRVKRWWWSDLHILNNALDIKLSDDELKKNVDIISKDKWWNISEKKYE